MIAIPEDIMATAKKVVESWLLPRDVRDAAIDSFDMNGLENSMKEIIARAILAERQRCAAIALCVFDDDDVWSDSHRTAGGIIAEAILAGDSA